MESFRSDVELPVRFRDLDTLGHVNDAVYGTSLEGARMQSFDRALEVPFEGRELVLAHLDVDVRRPVALEDGTVRVACWITDLGGSSIRMAYRVYAGADAGSAATAESVHVPRDGESPGSVPASWPERFREFEPWL